ncbi:hypothetical protein [Paenibacillus sp. OV219]|uniref:hypothetical protein n=1 Tax=Paenibacillus sp. OV219 TaxID=1884377 RepID=UPI0008BF9750|nr:hypothetical protein [Paenibacillus sp. OV219]SEO76951.1 hypothetical protein SAMN05518847_110189 [Paenibacillus sp. OV219]
MLRAAFGKVCVTPEERAPLQGYDPDMFIAQPPDDVQDDLFARLLLLDDGRSRHVLVSFDCCLANEQPFLARHSQGKTGEFREFRNTFPEGTRGAWSIAAGTTEQCVSVHATHTHSAPEQFGEKYTNRVTEKLIQLTNELQPVRLRAAEGSCGISVNRRPKLAPNESLPVERSMHFLMLETPEGMPLGGIVNCAVHPTSVNNPRNRVSPEMVGLAMARLEQHYGGGFVSLFLQGFSGDIGPKGFSFAIMEDTYPLVTSLADQLYMSIAETAGRLQPVPEHPLAGASRITSLKAQEGYPVQQVDTELRALRLGDIVLLSSSCEVFGSYASRLRERCSSQRLVLSGVSNGYTSYLPSPEAFTDGLGGYELNASPYSEEACSVFLREAEELIKEVSP